MKKAISLLLALVLCLSMCACGNSTASNPVTTTATNAENPNSASNPQNAIVGEWKTLRGNNSVIFNEDGSGSSGDLEFAWKYDEELSSYSTNYEITPVITIEKDGDYDTIRFFYWTLYRANDYEQARLTYLEKQDNRIAEYIKDKEKLQLNTVYSLEHGEITFTEISMGEDGNAILTASITNCTGESMSGREIAPVFCSGNLDHDGEENYDIDTFGSLYMQHEFPSGATETVEIVHPSSDAITTDLKSFNRLFFVSTIDIGGTEYYINWNDYIQK